MLYILTCKDKPDNMEKRMAVRERHLAYVHANEKKIRLAGPILDKEGQMAGSFFILDVEDLDAAKAFNAADPYSSHGVFGSVEILPFRVSVGTLN